MDKLIISLNGHSLEEIEKQEGVIMSVHWDALLETINEKVKLRDYEKIDGLIVTDTDIRVKISRKRGTSKKVKV